MTKKEVSYWDFIAEYLPNYEQRDDVLESDILSRYANNEYVDEEDIAALSKQCNSKNAWKLLREHDKALMLEAMDNYFEEKYSNKTL